MRLNSLLLAGAALLAASATMAQTNTTLPVLPSRPGIAPRMAKGYGHLPLQFEPNVGQTDRRVRFTTRTGGGTLFLTDTEAVLTLPVRDLTPPCPIGRGPIPISFPSRLRSQAHREGGDRQLPSPSEERGYQGEGTGNEKGRGAASDWKRVKYSVLRMKLTGAKKPVQVSGMQKLPGIVNYFRGNDPKKWHSNIPTYRKAKFSGVYKGVDMVYYGAQDGRLEYDFVVKPGADPKQIRLAFSGATKVRVTAEGDLALQTEAGEVRWHKPVTHQTIEGKRQLVACNYRIERSGDDTAVRFAVAKYDRGKPLVIDPVLEYSTYLGGSGGDRGFGISVDGSGNAYITGETLSTDFPTTSGALQTTNPSSCAFVTKLSANGSQLIYSTYLGGGGEYGWSIAVDANGSAYVTGGNASKNFPVTSGAFQTISNNDFAKADAFITKLSPDGSSLLYSTLLGGRGNDRPKGIAIDSSGSAYVTGTTTSSNFPVTPGAYLKTYPGTFFSGAGFVTKFNPSGSAVVYSTYLNPDGEQGIAIDNNLCAYITGVTDDGNYVKKLNAAGSGLVYSVSLGGAVNGYAVVGAIAVDSNGYAYVTGSTFAANFPITSGAFQTTQAGANDCFVSKLSTDGSSLVYSTYLGGSGSDAGTGIVVDSLGNAYVTGSTYSSDFPVTSDAYQPALGSDAGANIFFTKLNTNGTALLYSTYLGGSGEDTSFGLARDYEGGVYITGNTWSLYFTGANDFPTTANAYQPIFGGNGAGWDGFQGDGFVTKFKFDDARSKALLAVQNGRARIGMGTPLKSVLKVNGIPTSGKSVTFQIDGKSLGSATTDATGTATLTYVVSRTLRVGEHTLTASSAGDAITQPATSPNATFTVFQGNTAFLLPPRTGAVGLPVYLNATLRNSAVGLVNKTVTFLVEGNPIGTALTNANGLAGFTYTIPDTLSSTTPTLSVQFDGDVSYLPSSASTVLTVTKRNTSFAVSDRNAKPNQTIPLRARLRRADTLAVVGRTLTFKVNGSAVGTAVTDASGLAILSVKVSSVVGTYPITVEFAGDNAYNLATGSATLTIAP